MMMRRRQWSQHHPHPPGAAPPRPQAPPDNTTTAHNRHSNHLRAPRRHRPADKSNDDAHAAALRMFRSIANHLSSPTASTPWNLMRGKVIFALPLPLQYPKTDNTPMGTARSYRPAQPIHILTKALIERRKDPATHTRVPAQADGAQQASAETVSAHYQEARIELEARMHSTSLSLRAPKPSPARHCA